MESKVWQISKCSRARTTLLSTAFHNTCESTRDPARGAKKNQRGQLWLKAELDILGTELIRFLERKLKDQYYSHAMWFWYQLTWLGIKSSTSKDQWVTDTNWNVKVISCFTDGYVPDYFLDRLFILPGFSAPPVPIFAGSSHKWLHAGIKVVSIFSSHSAGSKEAYFPKGQTVPWNGWERRECEKCL